MTKRLRRFGRKLDLRLPADLDYFMRSQKYPEPVKDAQGRCLHYRYIHSHGFYQCFDCGWLDRTDIQDHPAPDPARVPSGGET